MIQAGNKLTVVKVEPFPGKSVAPPLKMGQQVFLRKILICSCGSEHYDVGLASHYNYITCQECGEELEMGDDIHWAHPTRFEHRIDIDSYMGLTMEEAQGKAESEALDSRIYKKDGESFMLTMDLRPNRLNFAIENNIVVNVKIG